MGISEILALWIFSLCVFPKKYQFPGKFDIGINDRQYKGKAPAKVFKSAL